MPNSLLKKTKTILHFKLFLFLLFSAEMTGALFAQQPPYTKAAEELWPTIEIQLNQQNSDTAFHFMLLLVRGQCGDDLECQFETYEFLAHKFTGSRNPDAGLFVSKEMLALARRQKDPDAEAEAYLHLFKFQTYKGYVPLAVRSLENALSLFEQTGNQARIVKIKLLKLSDTYSYRSAEEVLAEMEALLPQAEASGDTSNLRDLHARMIQLAHHMQDLEKMASHTDALEALAPAKPEKYKSQWVLITVAHSKAQLALKQKNFADARRYFQEAVQQAGVEPSPWLEVDALLDWYSLEKDQNNMVLAKSLLDRALETALEYNLDDLLTRIYAHKAEIAEAESQYAAALDFKKKELFYEEKYGNRTAGFNLENFYLEIDKEKQAVELNLKNSQLQYSFIIMVLVFLLAIGFSIGFYKHRKGMRELAAQNTIIQKQAEVLQNLDAAKSRFFANVSHELRTPLTLLLGPVNSLIKMNERNEDQLRLLKMAMRSVENLQQLVTQILDLTKLDAGKMELDEKPTLLLPFFRRELAQFESLAVSKQIETVFEVAVDEKLVAKIDRLKYRQIFNNLLSNAFKHTPEGGRVEVYLSVNDAQLQMVVGDTGSGIHPDDLPHLFDRYFQTNQPDKPIEGGTGIGLALCHEYVQLFGGKITVESEPGTGAIFRMVLPLTMVDEPEAIERQERSAELEPAIHHPLSKKSGRHTGDSHAGDVTPSGGSSNSKPTILVVEDQPELQDYIRFILEEKYHVLTAGNGKMALDLLRDEGRGMRDEKHSTATPHPSSLIPDLILSDLMMPVMDGYQLLEKLKSADATRHIPFILLTARADVRDKLKALRLGVDDYLLKPFNEEELLARIENLLTNQAGRREFIAENELSEETYTMSEPDRIWLESFENYIQKHLSSDLLTVPILATEFAMSESTLLRQLKRLTGLSPLKYIQEMRLDEARRLLETRQYDSIARVASKVGYGDINSFGRSFKQRFGKVPSEVGK